jgi:hypothetical protein
MPMGCLCLMRVSSGRCPSCSVLAGPQAPKLPRQSGGGAVPCVTRSLLHMCRFVFAMPCRRRRPKIGSAGVRAGGDRFGDMGTRSSCSAIIMGVLLFCQIQRRVSCGNVGGELRECRRRAVVLG